MARTLFKLFESTKLNQPPTKAVDSTTRAFPQNGRLNIPHESPVSDHETSLR